jgi:catechol 2,3-dioxygenase-like lactoylglutathione lyase family enzyme
MSMKLSDSTFPRPISNMQHTAFRCRDAEQTRWFYEDVLGLKLAAALDFEEHSGVAGESRKYMHLFFEMGDGNLVAFFDDPDNVAADFFNQKMNGFDSHMAMEVENMDSLLAMQKRIQDAGVTCLGPLDHGFAFSVYAFDPSGVQMELLCKVDNYDEIMIDASKVAHQSIREWTEKTRAKKEAMFGVDDLDKRGKIKAA